MAARALAREVRKVPPVHFSVSIDPELAAVELLREQISALPDWDELPDRDQLKREAVQRPAYRKIRGKIPTRKCGNTILGADGPARIPKWSHGR